VELFLFILANAAMFIRPGDIAPELATVQLYLILILTCFVLSLPKLVVQWTSQPWTDRPMTLCMLGLLVSTMPAHISHGNLEQALGSGLEFARVVLYFLLLVGVVDTPARLRQFLISLLVLVAVMAVPALLHFHGYINIPSIKTLERGQIDPTTGEEIIILQLVGTGIFNDPNDFCLILTMGRVIGFYLFNDRRDGIFRFLFFIPTLLLVYALIRTQSRGGLLAFLASVATLLGIRFGMRKMIVLAVVGVPVLLTVLGGRFSRMSTGEDTAQERIEIWREALTMLRGSPLFGNGMNTIGVQLGLVAHNSFVHAFAELGLLGGTFFIGAYYFSIRILIRLRQRGVNAIDPELRRTGSYLAAMLVGVIVSIFSISRNYGMVIYVPVGLVEVYQRVSTVGAPELRLPLNAKNVASLGVISLAFILCVYLFVRVV
jgi:putative inorganic carbon (HCO3(-)) transporter